MALISDLCTQREGKDTAKHQGSEAQGAAAMLRGKGEAAVAHAPPNGATHADGKLVYQRPCKMPSHNIVFQVKQCKLGQSIF